AGRARRAQHAARRRRHPLRRGRGVGPPPPPHPPVRGGGARGDARMSTEVREGRPTAGAPESPYAVELRSIRKAWPGVVANDNVSLRVRRGEIHALVGENGAGKSTLMNILSGLLRPDAGEILIDGQPARLSGPRDAIARGIGMVYQHFMLI